MSAQVAGLDLDLIEPISADAPCGENLEDTALLASFDVAPIFGLAKSPDTAPDTGEKRKLPEWQVIRSTAIEALCKSKDLRVLAHLGTALLRTDGLAAFARTLSVASAWLDTYWEQTFPLIDEDAMSRRNALNCFADQMAVLDRVRRVPLVSSRQHGTFCLRDIDIANGQAAASKGETKADPRAIDAAFQSMPLDELVNLHRCVADAREALLRIDTNMRDHAGAQAAPDFDSLSAHFVRIDKALSAQLAARPDARVVAEAASGNGDGAGAEGGGSGPRAVGAIRTRDDALRALDAVAEYFKQNEPSSPIPLFIDRAKSLVSKDFFEVLADLAPDALAQVQAASGLRKSS
jgi:type VI secretion system protein ImpA